VTPAPLEVRRGDPSDEAVLLGLFDEAVARLVARGQPEQWASAPAAGLRRAARETRALHRAPCLRACAAERGAAVLGVDCWAGAPGLVSWYERQGFVRTATYEARGKTGQVFEKPVGARQASGAARSGGVPRSRSPPTGAGVQRGEGMGRG
jgi:hypothetical protein